MNNENLEVIKNFLRVDFDNDDEYIKLLIDVAEKYIINAVGKFDKNNSRHKLLLLNIVSSLYENRQFTTHKANEMVAYTLRSIITQLQLESDKSVSKNG